MLLAVLAALVLAILPGGERLKTTPVKPVAEYNQGAPNVVVVMTDDQALDTMRAMPRTRRLLGRRGVTYRNAITTFPLCCPSRATFLTGQYAHNHGVLDNRGRATYRAFDVDRTLPVWLRDAGYRTGFVGKYLNGYGKGDADREVPPGWTDWYGLPGKAKQSPYGYPLNENGEMVTYGNAPRDYKTDVLADKAVSYIRERAPERRPFFLYVATNAPHKDGGAPDSADRNPEPAPRDRGRFEGEQAPRSRSVNSKDVSDKPRSVRELPSLGSEDFERIDWLYASQLESLLAVDRLVTNVVRELRRHGELDRTAIFFTSDHGFLRGQHRIDSGKSRAYEESIQVPLLVRGPGFPEDVEEDRVVANVDLGPTILELAGARPDVEVDGVSLLPFADRANDPGRAVLLNVYERDAGRGTGVRTPRFTYVEYDDGERELYDLSRDPEQLDSRHDDPRYARARKRLSGLIAKLSDCSGPSCRDPGPLPGGP